MQQLLARGARIRAIHIEDELNPEHMRSITPEPHYGLSAVLVGTVRLLSSGPERERHAIGAVVVLPPVAHVRMTPHHAAVVA